MKTIAVDFDGPIHAYSKGYRDGSIYDPPTGGAIASLHVLMRRYAVFIFTSRDIRQVAKWMAGQGFKVLVDDGSHQFWNEQGRLLITNRKIPAHLYVDDRAHRFVDWTTVLDLYGDM